MGNKTSKAIDKAKYTNELDLSYLDIKSLPYKVHHLKRLTSLNLSANKLSNLEKSGLDNLIVLQTLDLGGNLLKKVPAPILNMTWLQTLVLSFNKIDMFPASMKALTGLKRLELSGNMMKDLPDIFDAFVNLQTLKLGKNQLMDLPLSIGALKITTIEVKENPWKKVPLALARINTIETLDLSKGNINEFSAQVVAEFAKNENLRVLNLSDNDIRVVPDQVTDLFMLRELDLRKNPVKTWPEKAKKMMNLKFEFDELMKAELWKK